MNTELLDGRLAIDVAKVEPAPINTIDGFLVVTDTVTGRVVHEIVACNMSDPHLRAIGEAEAKQIADKLNKDRYSTALVREDAIAQVRKAGIFELPEPPTKGPKLVHNVEPKVRGRYVRREFKLIVTENS